MTQTMRRRVLRLFLACVVGLSLGQGANAVLRELDAPTGPVVFSDLNTALRKAGLEEALVPLSYADGRIDVLYIGGTECADCAQALEKDLGNLAERGRHAFADVAVLPIPSGLGGRAVMSVERCSRRTSALDSVERVKRGLRELPGIRAAFRDINSQFVTGRIDRQQAVDALLTRSQSLYRDMQAGPFPAECMSETESALSREAARARRAGLAEYTGEFLVRTPGGVRASTRMPGRWRLPRMVQKR